METSYAVLIGAGLATVGWLYIGRRSRNVARKQHTITVLLQSAFSKDFRDALIVLAPFMKKNKFPLGENHKDLKRAFQLVANYYEFIAVGLRNGDFDERLVRDSRRGTILNFFEFCQKYIWQLRTSRRRQSIYEHIEWLHKRWEKNPPKCFQKFIEWIIGRPFPGKRVNPHD